jgi:chloramphenicol 3-O phosphotransferase
MEMGRGRIVLLNGVGSSGKSSIARSLQAITATPFLHVAMDTFIDMLPDHLQDHADSFAYSTGELDGRPAVSIVTGPAGERLMSGMRHAIAALAKEGNDLIVDDVVLGDGMNDYERLLNGFHVHRVGVLCPLDVLEDRERLRGDRMIGLARWQFDRVHAGKVYDLTVDTSIMSPADCARLISDRFGL